MPDLETSRPYRERFLDNYDRAQLRREVAAVKPRKPFAGLRRKYATWALGATLAVGSIGAPVKMMQQLTPRNGAMDRESSGSSGIDRALEKDLRAAGSIASQVATGVQAAVSGAGAAATSPLAAVREAPQKMSIVTEQVREEFFKKEIPFGGIIYKEAKKNDLKPELVAAVVQAESRFKPTARSGAGAIGLMQLVPKTGRWMGARDLTNPVQNIAAGAKYLKYLHERFDGNETKVIAAYNAGEGNVRRFGGVPPFRETRKYVGKVRNFEQDYHEQVSTRVSEVASVDVGADAADDAR